MEETFGAVLIAVSLSAALAAGLSYLGTGKIYKGIGRSGMLWMYARTGSSSPTLAGAAVEIRQMIEAASARRVARGEAPLNVDAEVERRLRELGA
jgi:hypothetical protein